ncbi:MAG: hypothetical protein AAFS10_22675, partial [Myxococcota bacterium]
NKVSAGTTAPLVIITTNQERVLPDAFIRRCLVMQMKPPGRADLIRRGNPVAQNLMASDRFRVWLGDLLGDLDVPHT